MISVKKSSTIKFYCTLIMILILNCLSFHFVYAVFPEPRESIEERCESFEKWKNYLCFFSPRFLLNEIQTVLTEEERLLNSEEVVIKIDGRKVEIVGDIHGNIYALNVVLKYFFENLSQDKNFAILFLGDYVDRGTESIKCFLTLAKLKILFPNNVYLLRGNHETNYILKSKQVNNYTLAYECMALGNQYDAVHSMFQRAFANLSLAAIIDGRCICVHGGIPDLEILSLKNNDFIDILSDLKKPISESNNPIVSQVLWNDPLDDIDTFSVNLERGGGFYKYFGKIALKKFLDSKNSIMLIRAHQYCDEGYKFSLSKKVLTLFSHPHYCERQNLGAIAILNPDKGIDDFIDFICFNYEDTFNPLEKKSLFDSDGEDYEFETNFYPGFDSYTRMLKFQKCIPIDFDQYTEENFPLEEFTQDIKISEETEYQLIE